MFIDALSFYSHYIRNIAKCYNPCTVHDFPFFSPIIQTSLMKSFFKLSYYKLFIWKLIILLQGNIFWTTLVTIIFQNERKGSFCANKVRILWLNIFWAQFAIFFSFWYIHFINMLMFKIKRIFSFSRQLGK